MKIIVIFIRTFKYHHMKGLINSKGFRKAKPVMGRCGFGPFFYAL